MKSGERPHAWGTPPRSARTHMGTQDVKLQNTEFARHRTPSWGRLKGQTVATPAPATSSGGRTPKSPRWRTKDLCQEDLSTRQREPCAQQVFDRLYSDAQVKKEVRARKIEEKKAETEMLMAQSAQAPFQYVQEMCDRRISEHARKHAWKEEEADRRARSPVAARKEMSRKQQTIFIQKQQHWNEKREKRFEAQRAEQRNAERKYMDDHSIHREEGTGDLRACCHRLYKDSSQRTTRLRKMQDEAREELRRAIDAHFVHSGSKACPADVAARLHSDFQDRQQRAEQKRREQEEFIRLRASRRTTQSQPVGHPALGRMEPKQKAQISGLQYASRSPPTPSTTASESHIPDSGRLPSGNSSQSPRQGPQRPARSVTPQSGRMPLHTARSEARLRHERKLRDDASDRPDPQALDVEVSILAVSKLQAPDHPLYCLVDVIGRSASILRTKTAGKPPHVCWNESTRTLLLPDDILQFSVHTPHASKCVAEASLQMASLLRICSSGFDGKLTLLQDKNTDAPHLHVKIQILQGADERNHRRGRLLPQAMSRASSSETRRSQLFQKSLCGKASSQPPRQESEQGATCLTPRFAPHAPLAPRGGKEVKMPDNRLRLTTQSFSQHPCLQDFGDLISTSTFLPIGVWPESDDLASKPVIPSNTLRRSASPRVKATTSYEFEVSVVVPDISNVRSAGYSVQVPEKWLPDHLKEGRTQAEDSSLLLRPVGGDPQHLGCQVHIGPIRSRPSNT